MEPIEHHRIREAIQVFARNPIVRWTVGGLLAALCSVGLFAAEGELGKVNTSIAAQTAAVTKMQDRFTGIETKIGEISEKLVRVEERYAGHDHRIGEIVDQVSELRRRIDHMAAERDMRLDRWEDSMSKYQREKGIERSIQRLIKRMRGRAQ